MVLKRVSLALCLALPHFAFSSDVVLDSVEVVESVDDGYRARTSQIGKSNSPILEIPQTLNVVTNQQLKDKKARKPS